MNQANKDKLERHRPKLVVWLNDQTCHLSGQEKDEILKVIQEEFDPGYRVDLWCGSCVVSMMEYAFREMDARIRK